MDFNELKFMRKLKETFQIEADEHLKILLDGLLELEKKPECTVEKELINIIFREAHNLKGAARAVNHTVIQNICQSLENVLSSLRQNKITLTSSSFNVLYSTIDLINKNVSIDEKMVNKEKLDELEKSSIQLGNISEGKQPSENVQESPKETIEHIKKEDQQNNTPSNSTIRVSTVKLDKLLQQIEEMLTLKITSGQRDNAVEQILKDFDKGEIHKRRIQKDIQVLKRLTVRQTNEDICQKYANTFNSLLNCLNWQEEHLKEVRDKIVMLSKECSQDSRISGSIVDNLLEETKEILMQPCQTLFDAYPRMVRDISKSVGKDIQLVIKGAEIEIDRRILEEIKDPLIHLIRNSIDHGIESPEKRAKANKSKIGTIEISVKQVSGSNIDLCFKDDGNGIDIERIKQSALENNIIHPKDLEEMSDQDALMLMFQSGVTTSPIITDLSGRGMGMEIVNEKVEKLGGEIFIHTEPNVGTELKIRLPLSLATFRGVHITIENQGFIIPTHYLLKVIRLPQSDIRTIEGKECINFNGNNISFLRLQDVLGIDKSESSDSDNSILYILVIKASEVTIAIGVDNILNEQEIFIKGLGKQLLRIKNIAAATVMEWGKIIPILDPIDIVKTVTQGVTETTRLRKPSQKHATEKKKTILIVEDTVTARMLLKNILDSSGYIVKTAIDGIEAYSLLSQEKIDLLLSDIEMPRMDGFELVEKVRSTENLKKLPIVLCSSLSTKENIEKGVAVGANAYIVKSSFEQGNLLETIQKLL